jgi:hypothetical protein
MLAAAIITLLIGIASAWALVRAYRTAEPDPDDPAYRGAAEGTDAPVIAPNDGRTRSSTRMRCS